MSVPYYVETQYEMKGISLLPYKKIRDPVLQTAFYAEVTSTPSFAYIYDAILLTSRTLIKKL